MVKRWKVINCHSLSIRTPSVGNGCKRNSAKLQQPRWNLFFPTLITWFSTPVACTPFPWYSIFLFVFLVLLTYTCLSAPRWSPYKSSPSPCTSLSGGDLGKEMKILESKTIFCQCRLRCFCCVLNFDHFHLQLSGKRGTCDIKFSTVASYEGGGPRGCFNTCIHYGSEFENNTVLSMAR